jgi:hypothetical protein
MVCYETVMQNGNKALDEVERLRAAIRKHRDERGDDRCHADDGELYSVLPEGDTRPARETAVTLENCAKYIECRQTGREYVSPQRRIEELEADDLKRANRITDLELALKPFATFGRDPFKKSEEVLAKGWIGDLYRPVLYIRDCHNALKVLEDKQ